MKTELSHLTIHPPSPNELPPRRRLVIFGEDASTRESLARALETENYEVIRTADCQEAIKLFTAKTTAVALVDLGPNGGTAFDGVNWLSRLNRGLPLVILTSSSEFPQPAAPANLKVVLEKPVAIPALLIILEDLIERAEVTRRRLMTIDLWQEIEGIAAFGGF